MQVFRLNEQTATYFSNMLYYKITALFRVKTVSMFLNRLCRSGLAKRKAEGRTYRYFITVSGRKRLNYYTKCEMRYLEHLNNY